MWPFTLNDVKAQDFGDRAALVIQTVHESITAKLARLMDRTDNPSSLVRKVSAQLVMLLCLHITDRCLMVRQTRRRPGAMQRVMDRLAASDPILMASVSTDFHEWTPHAFKMPLWCEAPDITSMFLDDAKAPDQTKTVLWTTAHEWDQTFHVKDDDKRKGGALGLCLQCRDEMVIALHRAGLLPDDA